jgi:hypothetical protein
MPKSTRKTTKKRMGRPPTGRSPNALTTLNPKTLETIDRLAHQQNTTRSAIMRQLVEEALKARKQKP